MEKKLDTKNNKNTQSINNIDNKNIYNNENNNKEHDHHDNHSFFQELLHHFPYGIFSVALSLIALTLLDTKNGSGVNFERLFHSFHFLHILFASTGTVVTYSRFAKKQNLLNTLIMGTISPAIFCILSDIILPYLSGVALGVNMELHICFHKELHNIWPFLFMGLINGLVLKNQHSATLKAFSLGSHFIHILISSLASLFYLVSHGFSDWYPKMGYLSLFLIVAIVVPCTFSDVIIPIYFANKTNK